jgi:hypothetical protein
MNAVNDSVLIAPCGMNCALCASYIAQKNDLKTKGIRMPYCAGCRPRNKQCSFIKKRCSKLLTGEVVFCYECADFPCNNLKAIDARYSSRYRMSMVENLHFINVQGMEKFLKMQQEKWKCPTCGGLICCHNGLCFNCDLEKLKAKKKVYQWEDNVSGKP